MDLKLKQQIALPIVSDMFNPVAHTETLRRAEQPHRVFPSKGKQMRSVETKLNPLTKTIKTQVQVNDLLVMLSCEGR